MDMPTFVEIRVYGHLADSWSDWLERLAIRNEPNGEVVLSGLLADQAAIGVPMMQPDTAISTFQERSSFVIIGLIPLAWTILLV
jgi:hypothetical protein